jgi:hypothetical protein
MKKSSTKNLILLVLWFAMMIWLVAPTPSRTAAERKLTTMVSDLDFMFKNGTVLYKHENAKTGAALALYNIDASSWGGEKAAMLKNALAAKGWTSVKENSEEFVMCKNEMKASISRKAEEISVNGSTRDA